MSRKLRHSRSLRVRQESYKDADYGNADEGADLAKLPPRKKRFPSSVHKLNKWYYNLLFVLFVCLVAFLFWYGNKFSS